MGLAVNLVCFDINFVTIQGGSTHDKQNRAVGSGTGNLHSTDDGLPARPEPVSDLLTVRDAADRLGVAYSTLKQWIYEGSVRTTKTRGGHHRISEAEIQRQLLSQERKESVPSVALGKSVALVALSGRNQLRGIVEEVRGDGLLSQVRLRIGDQVLTAVITRDAVNELKLKRGDEAVAIIKSTEVMIGRTSDDRPAKRR
jgi:molybdopterin-binding protein